MASNFPTSLDTYTVLVDNTDNIVAAHPNDRGDAIEALEAKVGINSSAVTTSHDYLLTHLPGQAQNWDAGAVEIRAETFESDVATGTAPLTVASTTVVANLNASAVGGAALASLVQTTGNQSVGGVKTFTTAPVLAANTIKAADIQSNAVTTDKINADAVDGTKIADDSIDSEHIVDGSIDTAHIADDAVDGDKVANDLLNDFTTKETPVLADNVSIVDSEASNVNKKATLTSVMAAMGLVGVYDSGWFAGATANAYTKTHNLGTTALLIQIYFSSQSDGSSDVHLTTATDTDIGGGSNTTNNGTGVSNITTTQLTVRTGGQGMAYFYENDSGSADDNGPDSGYLRVIAIAIA